MKKLLVIFLVLSAVAVLAAVGGILLSRPQGGEAGAGGPMGPMGIVSGPTVLVWRLDGPVVEQASGGFPFSRDESDSMAQLYPAFRAARRDPAVKGLAVYVQNAGFGLAKAQELRRQLIQLERAGKFVDCYLETAGEGSNGTLAYYLASACGRILLAPGGDVNLLGLYVEGTFFKGSLDKLKVDPNFNRVGRYKSAAEVYTEPGFSPAAAEALNAVLDASFGQIVTGIAQARHLAPAAVRKIIDQGPYSAPEALELHLVDGLAYPDEFRDRLKTRVGSEPRLVRIEDYDGGTSLGSRRVAVLFALGVIVRGAGGAEPWGGEERMGSDDMAKVLRELADDDSVKAVVLRIDSPGGSALASDLILHEIELLKKRKPVVVSMSDVAASGGYYIAAKASKIVAEPATLTGSIGVVGGKFVTRRLEEEILGITRDSLQRGANAGLYSSHSSFTPAQSAQVQHLMDRVYSNFLCHVAAGRKMTREAVEAVASGRVWSGADAKRLGLVDELGGLDRAIELARQAAGIRGGEALRLDFYPERTSWLGLFNRSSEPQLPLQLQQLARTLDPRPTGLLELPPELAGISRPF